MKSIVIIAIAVVCSVVAVFGVLLALVWYDNYQYEQSIKRYDEAIEALEKKTMQEEYDRDAELRKHARDRCTQLYNYPTENIQEKIEKCLLTKPSYDFQTPSGLP